jgi:cobalt-zinc-cadmium efflux system membrane fusion protein
LLAFNGVSPLLLGPLADQPENARPTRSESPPGPTADNSVTLNDAQLKAVKVGEVEERLFEITHATVGSIDFNQENSLQVFTPYPGRITKLLAKAGDDVKKGQVLFDIDSPDLSTAEGTLIQAAAQLELTTKVLKRAQELFAAKGAAQKDVEQAVSDHKTAEGNYNAARNAARIFGKTDAEMDQIVATHRIDSQMPVPSPMTGRVTARNAAVGLYTQPGNTPAPYTVSDVSTMWMLASVPEAEVRSFAWDRTSRSRWRRFQGGYSKAKSPISRLRSTQILIVSRSAPKLTTRSTSCGRRCSPPSSSARANPSNRRLSRKAASSVRATAR